MQSTLLSKQFAIIPQTLQPEQFVPVMGNVSLHTLISVHTYVCDH